MEKTVRKRFTKEEKEELLKRFEYRCGHCGKKLDIHTMTIDHIHPIYNYGQNDDYNLAVLCNDCNQSKSNFIKDIESYLIFIPNEEKEKYLEYNRKFRHDHYDEFRNSLLPYEERDFLIPNKNVINKIFHDKNYSSYDIASGRYSMNKKQLQLINRSSAKIKLRKAYDGDAIDIYKLCKKCNKKYGNNTEYRNEYEVLNDIHQKRIFVITNSVNEIVASIVFDKLNGDEMESINKKFYVPVDYNLSHYLYGYLSTVKYESMIFDIIQFVFMDLASNYVVPVYKNEQEVLTVYQPFYQYLKKEGDPLCSDELSSIDKKILIDFQKILREKLDELFNKK